MACENGHTWTHQWGDDWKPDRGGRCDCGKKKWGIPLDKCKYCDAEAEHKCLVENDVPPGTHTEDVCSECLSRPDLRSGLIESWTRREWLEMD
jgi:hypothetical protein